MKKLFIVLAVASLGFVACNNESESKETADSAINATVDSAKTTIDAAVDSAKGVIDSAAGAAKDSVKSKM